MFVSNFQVLPVFKMNHSGSGKLIKREDLNSALKFKDFTFKKFRHMCILSGCDYASSIRGIGLQRARTVLEVAGNKGTQWAISNVREILHKPSLVIPDGYHEMFEMADKTFLHQPVFNPGTKRVVPLNGDVNNEFFSTNFPYPLFECKRVLPQDLISVFPFLQISD